jgi:hypothetical protein
MRAEKRATMEDKSRFSASIVSTSGVTGKRSVHSPQMMRRLTRQQARRRAVCERTNGLPRMIQISSV